ncbi:hypothetical protein [Vulcanisaeta thermophila]|uniref:hypothetical protein n=1 Tax=Vulcanisaeta thermophila TaxID=867917 RepID=UPI001180C40A|nr:hypothetical protein [Vulcanisaeta thermophila]
MTNQEERRGTGHDTQHQNTNNTERNPARRAPTEALEEFWKIHELLVKTRWTYSDGIRKRIHFYDVDHAKSLLDEMQIKYSEDYTMRRITVYGMEIASFIINVVNVMMKLLDELILNNETFMASLDVVEALSMIKMSKYKRLPWELVNEQFKRVIKGYIYGDGSILTSIIKTKAMAITSLVISDPELKKPSLMRPFLSIRPSFNVHKNPRVALLDGASAFVKECPGDIHEIIGVLFADGTIAVTRIRNAELRPAIQIVGKDGRCMEQIAEILRSYGFTAETSGVYVHGNVYYHVWLGRKDVLKFVRLAWPVMFRVLPFHSKTAKAFVLLLLGEAEDKGDKINLKKIVRGITKLKEKRPGDYVTIKQLYGLLLKWRKTKDNQYLEMALHLLSNPGP